MPHRRGSSGVPARRSWTGRTQGAQKKFHEIHWIFDVVTAVLVLKDGSLDVYESEPGFLKSVPDAKNILKITRENLFTLEDQAQGPPKLKDLKKAWNSRTSNAMKKIHEIHVLYGAQTAGLIFDRTKGELMVYESQRGFVTLPDGVQTVQRIPAERFIKICNHRKPTKPGPRHKIPSHGLHRESEVLDMSILDKPSSFEPPPLRPSTGTTNLLRIGQYFSL
jgi:hypothetical protein